MIDSVLLGILEGWTYALLILLGVAAVHALVVMIRDK